MCIYNHSVKHSKQTNVNYGIIDKSDLNFQNKMYLKL